MQLNKSFLSGVVCGVFIAGGLFVGLHYTQNSYQRSLSPFLDNTNVNDVKPQKNSRHTNLPVLANATATNNNDNETITTPDNKITESNAEHAANNVTSLEKGFTPLEDQSIDINWAPAFTLQLVDAFQLSDELYALGLITAIECKTTLCEIQFDLNSTEDFNVVFKIRDAFEQTSLKNHGLVFDFIEKENMVKILVGRNDDSFIGIYQ